VRSEKNTNDIRVSEHIVCVPVPGQSGSMSVSLTRTFGPDISITEKLMVPAHVIQTYGLTQATAFYVRRLREELSEREIPLVREQLTGRVIDELATSLTGYVN